jgi:hypothetical protein
MKPYQDSELDDILQDEELQRIAAVLNSAQVPEPPLDDAFRTGLRRQLMTEAWDMAEGRGNRLWRRAFAPPGMAWAGAAAGLILIASVVLFATTQSNGGFNQVVVLSPMDGSKTVALQQPILVSFNQPMDHASTEAAVQITPATNVAFSWQANKLEVQPTSGNLAPNTQYQVTIGPGAKTASGQQLATPQMFTFVTQAPPVPTPTPTPSVRPTPTPGDRQLVALSALGTAPVQWSADSSSVYFIDSYAALKVVPAKGGDATVVVPDSVTAMAMAPAGDRLAYIRSGKIEILTFASGKTTELAVTPAPLFLGWTKDKVLWASAGAVYTQGTDAPTKVVSLPAAVTAVFFAPDGAHVAYVQDQAAEPSTTPDVSMAHSKLFLLDLGTGKSIVLGPVRFFGWSPGGSYLMYSTTDAIIVADVQGNTFSTLASGGDPSWSSLDTVLLGSDTELYEVRPDGSASTKLANGTYHSPLWAPNGRTFIYFRGPGLYVATAPALPPPPTALELSTPVVKQFMDARLKVLPDLAATSLDDSGKSAYRGAGLNLTISGDPTFSRYYILTQETVSVQPDTTRFVVRLVLSHGKIDVSDFEETLTLVRDATTKKFLIDQATAGARHDLGKGAAVVSVSITADTVKVTFDSDLNPGTVQDGVYVIDAKGDKGEKLDATTTYADRVVTLSGLDLKPGGKYKLVVLTSVRDVQGRNVAAEYDLDLLGPALKKTTNQRQLPPSALPSPIPGD